MNKKALVSAFLWAYLLAFAFTVSGAAQATAFTYQGRLTDAGNPANGNYDMRFQLYDAPTGGNVIGGAL